MMNQQVEELTQKLLSSLPENQSTISVSKLQQYNFPGILIQEIENIVSEKLMNSLKRPESLWADSGGENVDEKWGDYIRALKENLQIPVSKSEAIIERSVERLLNLSVKPLSAIPEIVFEEDSKLNIKQLRERKNRLPIHSHLLTAMIRYMEKKELESISKENSGDVLKKIDKKLTESFTALHWAHYLRPLFELAGPQVNTNLIRLFYEDRGEHNLAGKFTETDTTIDENNFVVALSSSDATEIIELEEDQPSLFTTDKKHEPKSDSEETAKKSKAVEPEASKKTSEPEVEPWSDEPDEDSKDFSPIEDKDDDTERFNEKEKFKTEETAKEEEIEDSSEAEDDLAAITLDDNEPEHGPDPDKLSISEEYSFRGTNLSDEDDDSDTPLHSRFVFDKDYSDDENDTESEDTHSTIYDEMELVREDDLEEKKSVLSLFEVKDSEIDEDETEDETLESSFAFQIDEPDEDDEEPIKDKVDSEKVFEHKTEETEEETEDDDGEDEDIASRYFSGESNKESLELEEENQDDNDEDVPMWKSFLEREDFDEEVDSDEPEQDESRESKLKMEESSEPDSDIEDGFIDEPVIDLTKDDEDIEEKIETVEEWLSDDRNRFVDSIFSGSDMAYESALSEIVDFDNWKKASQYIEKEIFSRNLVDIYNEDAVDFTDRLHNYFNEYKS